MHPFAPLLVIGCLTWAQGEDTPITPPWLAAHPKADQAFFAWTAPAMAALRQDGTSDVAILEKTLKDINADVARAIVMQGSAEGDKDMPADPSQGDGWRLWTFWSVDMPAGDGLAEALSGVRASGVASLFFCHLTTLRAWEATLWRGNAYRDQILAAAAQRNEAQAQLVFSAWKSEVLPMDSMVKTFYKKGLSVIPEVRPAIALRVRTVPCFRLISPASRVHALDGFTKDLDLSAWVQNCRAWEERENQRDGGTR